MKAGKRLQVGVDTADAIQGKRAWAYTRVSSVGQQDNGSLEDQAKHCELLASEHGYQLTVIKKEVFFSDDPDRPVLDEVLEAARRDEFDILLVDKIDRFSRADPGITGHLLYEFEKRGVKVQFAEVPDDSFEGQIMRAVLNIVARVESVKIKRRTQEGRMRRVTGNAEKGISPQLFIAPVPLYGYVWDNPEKGKRGRYVVDDEVSGNVQRVFRDVASGKVINRIIREFDAEGIPTPGQLWVKRGILPASKAPAHGWQRGMIARIINEPKYYGEVYAKRHSTQRVKEIDPRTGRFQWRVERRIRDISSDEIVHMPVELCPPLVARDLAMAAQAQLAQNKERAERNLKHSHRELALLRGGFVVCYNCQHAMIARIYREKGDGTPRGSYVCNGKMALRDLGQPATCPCGIPNTINIFLLDAAVWKLAIMAVLDPTFLPSKVERAERETVEQLAARAVTRANLESLAAECERRKEGYLRSLGEIDPDNKEDRLFVHALIREQNELLNTYRQRLDEMAALDRVNTRQSDALVTITQRLNAWALRISEFTYEQKRVLLSALGCKITVAPRGVDLDGKGSRYLVDFDITHGIDALQMAEVLEGEEGGCADCDTQNLLCISFMPPMRRHG